MSGVLRVGIIGSGFIAGVHVRALRANRVVLAGIASSSSAQAKKRAGELGLDHAFSTVEELCMSDEVDLVVVCSPNVEHERHACLALAGGKHVILEKPVALNFESANLIATAARTVGRLVTVPFTYRYMPAIERARRFVREDLGGILTIRGEYQQGWALTEFSTWRRNPEIGGPSRAFADIGVHIFDFIEYICGDRFVELVSRMTHASADSKKVGDEDAVSVIAQLKGGATANFLISQVASGHLNDLSFEIAGRNGAIEFDSTKSSTLKATCNGVTYELSMDSLPASISLPLGLGIGYVDLFTAFVADTCSAITGHIPTRLPLLDDGIRAVNITEAVLRSSEINSWVEV